MKFKVLFVINGLGLGNSTRTHAVIERLHDLGASVHVITSNNGLWYFQAIPEVDAISEIESLQYGAREGKIDIVQTLKLVPSLMARIFRNRQKLDHVLDTFKPDVVVTDSEYTFTPMKRRGIPIVALNNSDVVYHAFRAYSSRPKSVWPQFLAVEMMDYFFHRIVPDLVISPTLDPTLKKSHSKFVRVGPIVRKRYQPVRNPEASHRAVVMLSGSTFGSPVRFTREALPVFVDVIGRSAPQDWKNRPGVVYHGKIRDTYERLACADVIVVNGGFSAVSEAFFMRKPVVVIPVPRHAEQWVNAKTIELLGVGLMANEENYEEKMLEALARREEFLDAYQNQVIDDGALQAAKVITKLVQGLPSPVRKQHEELAALH